MRDTIIIALHVGRFPALDLDPMGITSVERWLICAKRIIGKAAPCRYVL